ncbi:signal peptide peptidase SppA [Candidatus Methylomicrobium oryzae]|jgi:protease-4|uniref:signal peptide peptidase SppA n=1 Tax=Candidatus Methylomicrobium oryzae TaxID=2802053 RepID=UPI0019240182|nr:signal peptide peptidase SppA [Methylomicrobium sp. RS1]MBL1262658.1 signal peptide peptidase SppA [Methylomicrobium sp. RS1]
MNENQQDKASANPSGETGWERSVLEKVALAAIEEQARARRWGIVFKSATLLYLTVLLGIVALPGLKKGIGGGDKEHTAVVEVIGMIAEDKAANADSIIDSLRKAVKDEHTKGVILHANSPGGSPVQSHYVYEEIRKLKKEYPKIPIYAVVGDICASGCYYIASASDKIFVSQASLVGSIGVIMDGFGFVETMQKFGIERRVLTAGAHKAMLDPFSPRKEDETRFMQDLLEQVHQQFIKAVKDGRGARLKDSPDLFSGLVWTGEESLRLGIADAYGSDDSVAKEVIGAKKLVDFTEQESVLDRLAGKLGTSFGHAIGSVMQNWQLK